MKQTTFRTDDGYTLNLINGEWTDGDLTFANGTDGVPMGEDGEQVGGDFIGTDGLAIEDGVTMYCPNRTTCGNDGEYQAHRKVCPTCGTALIHLDLEIG